MSAGEHVVRRKQGGAAGAAGPSQAGPGLAGPGLAGPGLAGSSLASPARVLWRNITGEAVAIGGPRSFLFRLTLPLGVLLPVIITLVVAAVSESLNSRDGLLGVTAVSTTNSVYWLLWIGVTVFAVSAAYRQAESEAGPVAETRRYAAPRLLTSMVARWLVLGGLAAVLLGIATMLTMLALPVFFPGVHSEVDAFTPEGVRFLWALPVYAFAAVGVGLGIGALTPSAPAAVAVLTVWSLLVENAVILLPRGDVLTQYMPFLNGVYGSGQDLALDPPWGRGGALLYLCLVALVLIVAGWLRTRAARRR